MPRVTPELGASMATPRAAPSTPVVAAQGVPRLVGVVVERVPAGRVVEAVHQPPGTALARPDRVEGQVDADRADHPRLALDPEPLEPPRPPGRVEPAPQRAHAPGLEAAQVDPGGAVGSLHQRDQPDRPVGADRAGADVDLELVGPAEVERCHRGGGERGHGVLQRAAGEVVAPEPDRRVAVGLDAEQGRLDRRGVAHGAGVAQHGHGRLAGRVGLVDPLGAERVGGHGDLEPLGRPHLDEGAGAAVVGHVLADGDREGDQAEGGGQREHHPQGRPAPAGHLAGADPGGHAGGPSGEPDQPARDQRQRAAGDQRPGQHGQAGGEGGEQVVAAGGLAGPGGPQVGQGGHGDQQQHHVQDDPPPADPVRAPAAATGRGSAAGPRPGWPGWPRPGRRRWRPGRPRPPPG